MLFRSVAHEHSQGDEQGHGHDTSHHAKEDVAALLGALVYRCNTSAGCFKMTAGGKTKMCAGAGFRGGKRAQ